MEMNKFSGSALIYKFKDYWHEIRRYILLLVIPLIFCVVLYFNIQSVVSRQIEASAADTVQQVYVRISSMMHEVDMVSSTIFMDIATLNNISSSQTLPYTLDDPDSMCRQLEIRRGRSHYIKEIYLISEEWQIIFSDSGYYGYDSLNSLLSRIGIAPDTFESTEESTWNMQTGSQLTDPYCLIPYKSSGGTVVGRILITLDLGIFINNLSDLNTNFICLYNEDTLLTSRPFSEDITEINWNDERAVSRALGEQYKCFYVHVDDYTYMAAIDRSRYYYPFYVISVSFLIYAAIIFLLGFVYLSKVSRERYQQLTSLISALPQNNDGLPVSYQELFPKIQEALLSLPNREDTGGFTLSERTLHNVLYADNIQNLPRHYLEKIGIHDSATSCYVAIFFIRSFDTVALVSNHTEDVLDMAWVIFQSSLEQFAGQNMKYASCLEPKKFVAVFFEPECDSFSTQVTESCKSICQFMAEGYGIQLQAAISSAVSPSELNSGFCQAQSLEKFASAIDSSSYIISRDLLNNSDNLLLEGGSFIRQEQILLNTLLMEKYDLIPSMVHAILAEYISPLASDYALALTRLRAISGILSETLLSTCPQDFDVQEALAKLRSADSVLDLNAAVDEVYPSLEQFAAKEIHHFKEVDEARNYIRNNLADQNLNVSMICEAVDLIAQRLTPMFQEQLNMGIAEYVNYCRVEEAKRLLTDTKLTVKKIGEQVGYSTTDTFTRNFRKLENLTPTEYRRIITG